MAINLLTINLDYKMINTINSVYSIDSLESLKVIRFQMSVPGIIRTDQLKGVN